MLEFYEKRKLKQLMYSRPALIILAIPTFLLLAAAWGAYQKERSTQFNKVAVAQELAALKEREAVLSQEIERLNTDRGKEEEIRNRFEVGLEGERMIVIVDRPQDKEPTGPPPKKGFWEHMAQFFGW